jgi:hypothetical protein
MRNRTAALGAVVMLGLLGACELGDSEPPAPKPPPRVVQMASIHLPGGDGAKVYRAERTPTGGWVIYFEAKPSDPFLIYPAIIHTPGTAGKLAGMPGGGIHRIPDEKPRAGAIEVRYGRVIVRRSGDVQKVSLTDGKDGFSPLNFGFERTPERY